jgi:hypothetical protein
MKNFNINKYHTIYTYDTYMIPVQTFQEVLFV